MSQKPNLKRATYTAQWEMTGRLIYLSQPPGNLFGHLPLGSWPDIDNPGTLLREDGGDPWENARLICQGKTIVVRRDPEPSEDVIKLHKAIRNALSILEDESKFSVTDAKAVLRAAVGDEK